jgi:hypothetical protein
MKLKAILFLSLIIAGGLLFNWSWFQMDETTQPVEVKASQPEPEQKEVIGTDKDGVPTFASPKNKKIIEALSQLSDSLNYQFVYDGKSVSEEKGKGFCMQVDQLSSVKIEYDPTVIARYSMKKGIDALVIMESVDYSKR